MPNPKTHDTPEGAVDPAAPCSALAVLASLPLRQKVKNSIAQKLRSAGYILGAEAWRIPGVGKETIKCLQDSGLVRGYYPAETHRRWIEEIAWQSQRRVEDLEKQMRVTLKWKMDCIERADNRLKRLKAQVEEERKSLAERIAHESENIRIAEMQNA